MSDETETVGEILPWIRQAAPAPTGSAGGPAGRWSGLKTVVLCDDCGQEYFPDQLIERGVKRLCQKCYGWKWKKR